MGDSTKFNIAPNRRNLEGGSRIALWRVLLDFVVLETFTHIFSIPCGWNARNDRQGLVAGAFSMWIALTLTLRPRVICSYIVFWVGLLSVCSVSLG